MTELIIDVIGWIGSLEVIAAYALISYHRVDASSLPYQLLNFTGGAFLIINTIYYGAYPSTAINVVWLIIAFIAMIKIYKSRKSS
ncbi:MAG: hypothetical protein AAF693_11805 [Bacteroidota bacterium]